ncbi:MAG: SURF1 family protein [Burkholderiales bacterium]|nr:SURF1 family protein [Burkholderiales bacterium]
MTRWIPALALAIVVALTASLGQWQVRRGAEKDVLQAQRDAARAAAPVALAASDPALASLDGRRVLLVGRFDDAKSVFLDNRTRNGMAGFHVLTPLRLEGGAWVMVLRGWVARDARERTRLPVLPAQADAVRVEGFAQASLAQPMVLAAQGEAAPGEWLWQHYEADAYRRWSGLPVTEGIVRQLSELPDGLARDWVEPGSGADKHRAYAFQWFAMSGTAALAALVLGWRTVRRPR